MLIQNATVFYEGAFHPNTCIRIQEGKVSVIDAELSCLPNESAMDLAGDYLLPGMVDVHIHAFMGQDTMHGEEAVRHMSRELYKKGVAAFLPTTMSASPIDTQSALAGIAAVMKRPEVKGAVVLGAHMEAPFLQSRKAGAQLKEYFAEPLLENWKQYTNGYEDIVRLVTLAPELEGAMSFIQMLTNKGITVSIGHTDASAEVVHEAAQQGASHTTHTFNAQSPLGHRAPGVPGAALVDDRIFTEFISDGIHLHPDIVRLIVRAKGAKMAVAITDAMEAAGMPDGKYQLGGQDVYVKEGAARLEDGTLAGSTLTMVGALKNMISFGIAPQDAVRMVTQTPADSIGNKEYGVIHVGAPGSLTRFDPQWNFKGMVTELF